MNSRARQRSTGGGVAGPRVGCGCECGPGGVVGGGGGGGGDARVPACRQASRTLQAAARTRSTRTRTVHTRYAPDAPYSRSADRPEEEPIGRPHPLHPPHIAPPTAPKRTDTAKGLRVGGIPERSSRGLHLFTITLRNAPRRSCEFGVTCVRKNIYIEISFQRLQNWRCYRSRAIALPR